MSRYIGKFVGVVLGLDLGGPTGAVAGLILGHMRDMRMDIDRQESRNIDYDYFPDFPMNRHQRSVFAVSVIVLGAKLAKADGHVTREEVMAFRRVFRTRESQLAEVGRIFDQARHAMDGYEPYAARLAQTFIGTPKLLEEVLAGLFYIAVADSSRLSRPEMVFLRRVAVIFGFNEADFTRIAARAGIHMTSAPPPPKKDSAYDVLGLPTTASDKDIKRTYHALIRKHHPDMLLAKGLPAEQIEQATERMKHINAAYSEICKMRDLK